MKQILKPCPFCGSIPEIDTGEWKCLESMFEPELIIRQRIKITCSRCFLEKDIVGTRKAELGTSKKEIRLIAKDCAREAIENFWNRRNWA